MTKDELENSVEVVSDFHVKEFDLTIEEDKKKYEEIMTRSANHWYQVVFVERNGMKRIVEWVQRYGELSPAAKDAARSVGYAAGNGVPHQNGR